MASSMLAERLPAMWGSATEAMEVSSTSMKVGRMTARAIIHGLMSRSFEANLPPRDAAKVSR